jgi:hypothetical protein
MGRIRKSSLVRCRCLNNIIFPLFYEIYIVMYGSHCREATILSSRQDHFDIVHAVLTQEAWA